MLSRLLGLGAEMPDTVEIGLAVVTYPAYLQSQYDTFCLDFSLAYLTSTVYLSGSGCTLTFGPKSEGSQACLLFAGRQRGRSLIKTMTIYTYVLNRGPHGVVSPADAI